MLDAEMPQLDLPSGVEIRGVLPPRAAEVLTHDALALVADLVRRFRPRVEQLPRGAASCSAATTPASAPAFSRRPRRSARATGPSRRSRRTSRIDGRRSRAPSTARRS